ncbi:MAG: HAD family hydrolase [Clostridiales bacterium]|jgi:Cof subfamily protein (haloacid dehalogenase superfamily)|nr:HAD family hydrolase [Clostridiales bacterium]
MKYKLIVSDFDHTLNYRSDYTPSQRTLDAIAAYQAKGGIFAISTGRVWSSIQPCLSKYNLDKVDMPIMCVNGSVAYSIKTGKVILEERLTNDQTIQILNYVYALNQHVMVESDSITYVQQDDDEQTYLDFDNIIISKQPNLMHFVVDNKVCPHACGILCNSMDIEQFKVDFDAKFDFVDTTILDHNLTEVTSNRAGKGNLAVAIARLLNVDVQNMICIGDGNNDISMIELAGLGVAVGNASDSVKKSAKLVTDRADQDGVAKIIEEATQDLL